MCRPRLSREGERSKKLAAGLLSRLSVLPTLTMGAVAMSLSDIVAMAMSVR